MKTISIKIAFFAIVFVSPFYLYGKPMFVPTKEEAIQSKWIVIARYAGYKNPTSYKIDYFQGPIAKYKIINILKGDVIGKNINVRYDFQDGSACLPLKGWKFTKDKMPQIKSEWILFLKQKSDKKIFVTYRGDYGRWKATEENIKEIKEALRNKN